MANTFQITISATDKATDTVRKVNRSLNNLTAPFQRIGTSFKSLGRELGFQKIGKDLSQIGQTAGNAARAVGTIVAPMAAIAGVGSVAGIVALADGWAKLGRSVTYSAQNIGIGTDKLQAFQGAAKLAGLSSEAMTQGLQSLGDTMESALYGRNQQALVMFDRLGIGIKRTKDGAMDVAGEFKALAGAIYKLPTPQAQNFVASNLGLSQLLPLIRMGPAAFGKLEAKAREMGLVMDGPALQAAIDYAASLTALQNSGLGLKTAIGNAIIPALKPLTDQLQTWVSANRILIGQKIGQWAQQFGQWLGSIDWAQIGAGIRELTTDVKSFVGLMGGWKRTAIGVAVVMNAGLISSVVSLGINLAKLGIGVGAIIAKFGRMAVAANAASAAANAATGAGAGVAGGAGAAVSSGGWIASLLSRLAIGEGLVVPLDSPEDFRKHVNSLNPSHENTWQMWGDIFHGRKMGSGMTPINVDPGLSSRVMSFFQQQGWSKTQAAGLAANLIRESSLNPLQAGDNGAAYGIGQWHADRQAEFERWSGHSIRGSGLNEQLRFVQYELTNGSETAAGDRLRQANSAEEAGALVSRYYERPADANGEAAQRAALAQQLNGQMTINVKVDGPPGTKATVKTEGTASNARISYTGVGAGMG